MSTETPASRPTEGWARYFAARNRVRVAEIRRQMRGLQGPALVDAIADASWHTQETARLDALADQPPQTTPEERR